MATQASSRVPSAAANGKHGHSLISDARFRRLYELTLRLRLEVQRVNRHALAGREAALAAVSSELRPGDALVTDQPIPTAIHLAETATPFAERVIAAMARATADHLKKNARVTVIFSGSATEDLLREAHALAGAARLSVLFVEDAFATPLQPRSRRASAPDPNLLIAIPVDAQDVVALYRVVHESMIRAREGSGATRILCNRWPSRSGQTADAVDHLERWLQTRGLPAQNWRREILAEAEAASSGSGEKIFTEVL